MVCGRFFEFQHDGGVSGGVPPTMAKKVFQMSSRRLVLPMDFAALLFEVFWPRAVSVARARPYVNLRRFLWLGASIRKFTWDPKRGS